MKVFAYFVPYVAWIILTILLIENGWLDDPYRLNGYWIYSAIVGLVLETLRNRYLAIAAALNKSRFALYVGANLLLGIPLLAVLVSAQLPLRVPVGLFEEESTLLSWQQYLYVGYFAMWFALNAIIVKPSRIPNIILFLVSPVLLFASSYLVNHLLSRL